MPAALIVVPVGAWVRLVGQRAGLYEETVGLSMMVALEALVLLAVGAWTTARVQRLEQEKLDALSDLIRLGSAASTPLIETAPVGLAVLDRDLRYLYVNPALAGIGRVPALASLGQRIDRVVPAFGNETQAALARVVETGAAIRDVEVSGQTPSSGLPGTWLLSAEALSDAEGETIGLTVSVVDITERKHREETLAALAEMQRQAQAIGESIPFGIWLAGPDGRMRYLSESYLEMSGQTMEQARDSGWMTTLAPDIADQVRQDWAETVAARTPWNHEIVIHGADGSAGRSCRAGFRSATSREGHELGRHQSRHHRSQGDRGVSRGLPGHPLARAWNADHVDLCRQHASVAARHEGTPPDRAHRRHRPRGREAAAPCRGSRRSGPRRAGHDSRFTRNRSCSSTFCARCATRSGGGGRSAASCSGWSRSSR